MSQIKLNHKTRLVTPQSLVPNEKNAVIHPKSQIDNLASLFKKFGFNGSVFIGTGNKILAGHGRVEAAIVAGMPKIPVTDLSHLSEDEQDAFMLADNKSGEQKLYDEEKLNAEISRLTALDFGLSDLGIVESVLAEFENGYPEPEHRENPGKKNPDDAWDVDEDEDGESRESEYDSYDPKQDEEETSSEPLDKPIPKAVPARVTAGSAWRLGKHVLVCGNSSDSSMVHKFIGEESAHSIVTDPPYGISFMGKEWDHGVPSKALWDVWYSRVKPGAHMLSFCATRMYHHMAINIEQAGFEPRDMITWMYGSGFPKSRDISKAIDKAAGAKREVIGEGMAFGKGSAGNKTRVEQGYRPTEINPDGGVSLITTPSTHSAKKWSGWGTALKPSQEPIMLAMKPLGEKTFDKNVVRYGTGALNIDGSRVKASDQLDLERNWDRSQSESNGDDVYKNGLKAIDLSDRAPQGRWPANTILSHADGCVEVGVKKVNLSRKDDKVNVTEQETIFGQIKSNAITKLYGDADGTETVEAWECVDGCPVKLLDEQSGNLAKQGSPKKKNTAETAAFGGGNPSSYFGDSGGASRFFYVAKPSRSDKSEGNDHATVKPIRLMEYLIRMITPPGGTVLEPFAGSGTTLLAAERLHMKCVAFELDPHHCDIIVERWQNMTGRVAEPISQI